MKKNTIILLSLVLSFQFLASNFTIFASEESTKTSLQEDNYLEKKDDEIFTEFKDGEAINSNKSEADYIQTIIVREAAKSFTDKIDLTDRYFKQLFNEDLKKKAFTGKDFATYTIDFKYYFGDKEKIDQKEFIRIIKIKPDEKLSRETLLSDLELSEEKVRDGNKYLDKVIDKFYQNIADISGANYYVAIGLIPNNDKYRITFATSYEYSINYVKK